MLSKALGFYALLALSGGNALLDTVIPPTITNLSYTEKSIEDNSGISHRAIMGTFDFTASDGDVTSITIEDVASGEVTTAPIDGTSDLKSGSVAIYAVASTSDAQIPQFNIWVSDPGGSISNSLRGSVIINASVAPMNTKNVQWEIVSVQLVP